MKPFRIAALGLAVVLWAVPAHADSIPAGDPKIKFGGGDPASPTPISSAAFYIESPFGTSPSVPPTSANACMLFQSFFGAPPVMTGSSPTCLFENVINPSGTGQNITQLVFDVLVSSGVTCALINQVDFKTCSTSPFDDGKGTSVIFSNGSIPFQTDFSVSFTGFPKNTDFGCAPVSTCPQNAATSPSQIPEPGTLVLFVGGIGALLVGRRLRARSLP